MSKESALSTEQRGILRFSIGYLVYNLRGNKRRRLANAAIVLVITVWVFQVSKGQYLATLIILLKLESMFLCIISSN